MIVFLSHKMSGLTDEEVYKIRNRAKKFIESKFPNEKIEYIENYVYDDAPEDATNLWYLGRSIQEMRKADTIFFCDDYRDSRGCCIELTICMTYSLDILNSRIGNIPKEFE